MSDSHTERRFNALTGDWVLVSQGRTNRPWSGQTESGDRGFNPDSYDSDCHLCPGNSRATGHDNPDYQGLYVFDNDFPALSVEQGDDVFNAEPETDDVLFVSRPESGRCRVVCFSDDHSLTLAQMSSAEIVPVIQCFRDQTDDLLSMDGNNHVQIFENRGQMMGCSNPHPHAQIWAQSRVPSIPARESRAMSRYHAAHGESLLEDYVVAEVGRQERVICLNDHFAALVPYWAAWPFETLIVPTRPVGLVTEFSDEEVVAFANILRRVCVRYDNLFQTSFPYSAGIHQRPANINSTDGYHLHMHFFPPLLRSATVKKFMVGYEMLAEAQRDLSPEEAAGYLRDQSEVHFRHAERERNRIADRPGDTSLRRQPPVQI